MDHLIYNLSMLLFRVAVNLAAITNPKAKRLLNGKNNWKNEVIKPLENGNIRIWFHCASLGEFEQGRPIIEGLKSKYPGVSIILTFFSPSGYEVRKNYQNADLITYIPWDTRKNAREFLDKIKPDIIVFIKYEFWRYFLEEGVRLKIPIFLVSGIFRPSQLFFRWYGNSYRKILNNFQHFFVQNQQSVDLLRSLGLKNITLSGDTRFDRVKSIVQSAESIELVDEFKNGKKVLVAGSVWKEDLERVIPLINDEGIDLKFIIAPHEIDNKQIEAWRNQILPESILFSEIPESSSLISQKVLIIDNIGLLSRLYRYGEYAFIGGAYGPGLHNTLEAVSFGMPVFFGNRNYKKYQEALDLITIEAGYPVNTYEELRSIVSNLETDDLKYRMICDKAREYIESKTGATNIVLDYLQMEMEKR